MTLGELLQAARELLDDTVRAFLYPDEQLTRFANNAVREVAIRTRCMKDDTAPRCRIALQPDTDTYVAHPSILAVTRAVLFGTNKVLTRITSDRLDDFLPGWDAGKVLPAQPEFIVFDRVQGTVRLAPTPDSAYDLRLTVLRTPDEDERMESPDDEPVINVVGAEDMKHWIAHEAYALKDTERYDPERSAMHLQMFTARFGERPSHHALTLWSTQPMRRVRPHYF